jgi:hypothetical protein
LEEKTGSSLAATPAGSAPAIVYTFIRSAKMNRLELEAYPA